MARMPNPRVLAEVLRSGNLHARLRAAREGLTGVRLQLIAAALDLGLLDALDEGPASTEQLAGRLGAVEQDLLVAYLRVLAAAGVITGEGSWRLTRFGRAVVGDDVVRASYEGFGGYHTELYRDLPALLRGGPGRRDTAEQGEVIARLSAAIYPLIRDLLVRTVTERRPRRVLDIGCGAGLHLAAMLEAAPDVTGIGVDVDPDTAALARRTLSERGLADRASVEAVDIQKALAAGRPGALTDRIDLALLANVIYYVPVDERVELLRAVAHLLAPGGALVVVTTVAGPQLFSRHLDLLLRAQEGRMELPAVDVLLGQLREVGLQPQPVKWIGPPGAALGAVTAIR
ncbi:SAM-dependent methyltransferase [Geodermatophilus sabuli]|uniref:Methyltransferase domain-containing protein n=1 Tax=Geodermatophilus sabuli TaxID=1564158 RepID=A0A285EJQ1_9ACTN|nr:class I SAM-dependent methyltransferase [Geodermatophilus sabuli]MBB3087021.1 SAM-dependent methyltransferase [Geodermatophilus sabuli]SNX99359.1 Methyltransferase domain-containing protein [Geodermatophilus sabuli]